MKIILFTIQNGLALIIMSVHIYELQYYANAANAAAMNAAAMNAAVAEQQGQQVHY